MSRPTFSALEILEARIAPAAFITFTEADGDTVKVSTSKGTVPHLTDAVKVMNGKLTLIDFVSNPAYATEFANSSLTVTVSALGMSGDGVVNVGYINATGFSLGAVLVKGDLGKIVAGSDNAKPAVASLTLNSLGATNAGAPDLLSTITGNVGALKIFGNVTEAALHITGKLASATIGGNLNGGSDPETGSLVVEGASGAIKIGGDLEGGSGSKSGSLYLSTTAKNGSVTVNGNLVGQDGPGSGSIRGGNVASIFVGGYLNGGSALGAGTISAGTFTTITVSGDVYGGSVDGTGNILVVGSGTSITVGGSLQGSSGKLGGTISYEGPDAGSIGSITVKGSIVAGSNQDTGEIRAKTVGSIFVGGSLRGGGAAAVDGGTIQAGNVKTITIVGSLEGNAGPGGGSVLFLNAGSLKIGGSVNGQFTQNGVSGAIKSLSLTALDIGGSLDHASVLIGGNDTPGNKLVLNTMHVGGSVLSSYVAFGSFERANVKVGSVQIDGTWTTSSLVVGAINPTSTNFNFGDANDALALTGTVDGIPTINSIVIEGAITGTNIAGDHYGFVAGKIGAFRAGAVKVLLKANSGNDQVELASTQDVTIHEIGGATGGLAPAAPALPGAVASQTFIDTDGDTVRVTSSKGTSADLLAAMSVTGGGQLTKLDLSGAKWQQKYNGANIAISVIALGAHGNGVVDVGEIDASNIALGSVLVKGDLGRLTAGTQATKPAVGSLTLNSLGVRLTSTGAPDLHSAITGNLGPVKIFGDVLYAFLDVAGTLGATTIGGSLYGGGTDFQGSISAPGNVGAVKIGGSIYGGTGDSTGTLTLATGGRVTSIFVGGDLAGGGTQDSGSIFAGATGAVFIGGNQGAGTSVRTGIVTLQSATSFTLGGNLGGGSVAQSGAIQLVKKSGSVTIGGSLTSSNATNSSGYVKALAGITSLTIQGSILTGKASGAGTVQLNDATSIFVGGSLYGNSGAGGVTFGGISAGKVGAVTINGTLLGGGGGTSGSLTVVSATSVKILGDVAGFTTLGLGNIHAIQSIGTLDISGAVQNANFLIGSAASTPGSTVLTKLHVGGSVSTSNFFFGSLDRADVKVGTAVFDGNWSQSNFAVGVVNYGLDDVLGGASPDNVNFGDGHDHRAAIGNTGTPSSVASIIVEGRISGGGGPHYGFVANKIGAFRAGAITLPLHATGPADTVTFGANADVSVTEAVQ